MGWMEQDHRGQEGRGEKGKPRAAVDPADERKSQEGQQAPAEARGYETPAQPLFDAASRSRRQRHGHEGPGKRQPAVAEEAGEQTEGGEARKEPSHPEKHL